MTKSVDLLQPALRDTLHLPQQAVYYRVYRPGQMPSRRLLLLHGGGVAGRLTWGGILPHLARWNEILVPDLRGAGKTHYPDRREHNFTIEEVVGDIAALLDYLGWDAFDLGGYSFGGLAAMLLKAARPAQVGDTFLLEPALFGKLNDDETIASRELMLHAAKRLRHLEHVDAGLELFLDAIAPDRTRGSKNEEIVRGRLAHRPAGLACAIECVFEASQRLNRQALVAAQAHVRAFIGGRSHPEGYALCRAIAAQYESWDCHLIEGADHALPFQKPEVIAEIMNRARENG
jgi:pimeloyl-ACP methyl ester carboxylesterase